MLQLNTKLIIVECKEKAPSQMHTLSAAKCFA